MPCSNCYNGCPDIVSDKCVKYTGVDVPVLGIQTGDSLSYVEQAIITFLTATLDGSGIKITLPPDTYCDLVTKYLPDCEDVTALNLFQAVVAAACDLQEQVDVIKAELAELNADYDIDCLPGVFTNSDTHTIVQAVITKLCEVDAALTALAIDIDTNYVKLADLNSLIQAYLDSITPTNLYCNRMVPYTVVEYYGSLTNFDITGAGIGQWANIYLCNGQNGTPDKRGMVPVGAIVGVPGGSLNPKVDPALDPIFNPNYSLLSIYGNNKITLSETQIPSHTHIASVIDPGHTHDITIPSRNFQNGSGTTGPDLTGNDGGATTSRTFTTDSKQTGISVTNAQTGGGLPHANNQPAIACYYIMYIP